MPKAHWFSSRRFWPFITVIPSGVEESYGDKLQVTSRDVSTSLDMTAMVSRLVTQDEWQDRYSRIFDRRLRRDASALATSRRPGGCGGGRQRRRRSICSAQSGVEQSGNRRLESCWCRDVRSRWAPR